MPDMQTIYANKKKHKGSVKINSPNTNGTHNFKT